MRPSGAALSQVFARLHIDAFEAELQTMNSKRHHNDISVRCLTGKELILLMEFQLKKDIIQKWLQPLNN